MTVNDFDWVTKRLNCTVEGAFFSCVRHGVQCQDSKQVIF